MKKLLKKYNFLILATLIVAIGTALRFYRLEDRITFYGDNSRDFLLIYKIFKFKEWVWHGPAVSVLWTLLSPIYYYFLAPIYLLFKFNPMTPFWVTAFFGSAAIASIIYVSYKVFGRGAAIITGVIYAFSFIIIRESGIGLNPGLITPFTPLLFYSVIEIIRGKEKFLTLLSFTLAMSISFHASGFFVIPPLILLFIIHKPQFKRKTLLLSLMVFTLFALVPYAIQEKKFAGYNIGVMLELIKGEKKIGLLNSTKNFFTASSETFFDILFPGITSPYLLSLIKYTTAALVVTLIMNLTRFKEKIRKPDTTLSFFIIIYLLSFVLSIRFISGGRFDWWLAPVLIPLLVMYIGTITNKIKRGYAPFLIIIITLSLIFNIKTLISYSDKGNYIRMSKSKEIAQALLADAEKRPFNLYIISNNVEEPGGVPPQYYLLWYYERDPKIKERYFEWLNWARERKENLAYLIADTSKQESVDKKLEEIKEDLSLLNYKKILTNEGVSIYRIE